MVLHAGSILCIFTVTERLFVSVYNERKLLTSPENAFLPLKETADGSFDKEFR